MTAFFHWPRERTWLLQLILLAFALRIIWLNSVPPGWRDDELINSLVISQKVLDGNLAVYYADASGHEALYHALNAIFLGLFGPSVPGIRWLSVILGTLTVPLTYLVGRRMFGQTAGWVAAAGLAFSFWSLMYSRIGLRHILLPLLVLAAFYFFWQPLAERGVRRGVPLSLSPLLSSLFTALGFYTYFAGRGVPLILLAFMGYVLVVAPQVWRQQWRQWGVTLALTLLLALPLVIALGRQPQAEGRVAELAVPLVEARQGNFAPLQQHIVTTLNMFHSDGDGEWLYNIPQRPVFGVVGALFFWLGVALAAYEAALPVIRMPYAVFRKRQRPAPDAQLPITDHQPPAADYRLPITDYALPSAFLLFWWLAGISEEFVSVPPASLGHTIMAQPAVYLLAALPVWKLGMRVRQPLIPLLLGLLLVGSMALRDVPDYFVHWPQRGMVRFLYRADIHEVATYLNEASASTDHQSPITDYQLPITNFGMTGLLAGPWDKIALQIDIGGKTAVSPRWYNPERALLLQPALSFHGWPNVTEAYADAYVPEDVALGEYQLSRVTRTLDTADSVCFVNGLCLATAVYDPDTHILELGWWVKTPLVLPEMPLISNPPPPGVYSGPRLAVFGQLWDAQGNFLAGDDGLWVDPYTLQPGDQFVQQHRPQLAEGVVAETAVFGLYDPMTGIRILTEDGRDYLQLTIDG